MIGSPSRRGSAYASVLSFASFLIVAGLAGAQDRRLELEDIYSPDEERQIDFSGSLPELEWIDESSYVLTDSDSEEDQAPIRVDAARGSRAPFYDRAELEKELASLPGVSADEAESLADDLRFDVTTKRALFNHADDLFLYDLEAQQASRLTFDPAEEVGEELSPDGRWVSFIRDDNIHLLDLDSGRERQLTDGGSSELFNGRLDWVYQEEVYGRGNFKGYWWSPDSSRIGYLELDESPVREFTVVDHLPTELDLEVTNYPKAGSPNPTVRLGVIPVLGGATTWIDTSRYAGMEHLIVSVGWTPDGSSLVVQVQDREQTWLDLALAGPDEGTFEVIFRETSPAFVNNTGEPVWLDDGSFLWLSERTGYQHVYHFESEGELRRQLTEGEWEVRRLHGVDEERGFVYFDAMEHDPIAPHVYRAPLAGGSIERLSQREGSHRALWSPEFDWYADTWSDVRTPPQLRLHRADGAEVRVIDDNPVPELAELALGTVERLQVPTRDGFPMEAMILRPPDFDPAKRYPVLQYNYGGPHSPVVRDAWGGSRYLWHQLLAQRGYVIWMCDNRSASGKGIEPTWKAYRRMGVIELQDIEDGVAWLREQPWVDPDRIGIWGWSYGGFMASFALTHSKSFKVGIAGAPVTDWRLYDSIYTERYMRRPQHNREGYDETSVIEAAGDLHGRLLLLHGTMDDNVHLQQTLQLVYALQKAGKEFELMLYPKSRHGIRDPELVFHLQRTMTDFVLDNL